MKHEAHNNGEAQEDADGAATHADGSSREDGDDCGCLEIKLPP